MGKTTEKVKSMLGMGHSSDTSGSTGHVSTMEKIKDKLHIGGHQNTTTGGNYSAGSTAAGNTGTGYSTGQVGAQEPLTGNVVDSREPAVTGVDTYETQGNTEVVDTVDRTTPPVNKDRTGLSSPLQDPNFRAYGEGGVVLEQEQLSEVIDRPVDKEIREQFIEHRPVEVTYQTQTNLAGERAGGMAQEELLDERSNIVSEGQTTTKQFVPQTFTTLEDRTRDIEQKERFVEHHPTELVYKTQVLAAGEQAMGVSDTEIVDTGATRVLEEAATPINIPAAQTYTEIEDRAVDKERTETVLEHHPVEQTYVTETKAGGIRELPEAGRRDPLDSRTEQLEEEILMQGQTTTQTTTQQGQGGNMLDSAYDSTYDAGNRGTYNSSTGKDVNATGTTTGSGSYASTAGTIFGQAQNLAKQAYTAVVGGDKGASTTSSGTAGTTTGTRTTTDSTPTTA